MLGLLPARGTTVARLRASGQWGRLCGTEWRAYAEAFGGVRFFTYGESEAVHAPGVHVASVSDGAALRACAGFLVTGLSGVLPAFRVGKPFVVQLGYDPARIAELHGKPVRACLLRALRRIAVRRASGVLASHESLAKGWPSAKTAVVPNGVDLDAFPYQGPRPRGPVLFVGRLTLEKRVDWLLRAAGIRPVVLVGAGPEEQRLRTLAATLGASAHFAGAVWHGSLPSYYREASVFVLPSATEGCPKALLEAMATGLPCLVSEQVPGIVTCGLNGYRFSSVRGLQAQLEEVAACPGAAMIGGRAARRTVEERFDLRTTLAAEVAFLTERLGRA